jgi:ribosomal protein S18 acetylase RimI-like enzyme
MSSNQQPTTIATAANQYFSRPADERFPSLQALIDARECERQASAECVYNLRDLRAVAVGDVTSSAPGTTNATIQLVSPKGVPAQFTHYSFGQLARTIGAPAGYLRELPASIAADAINYGLKEGTAPGTAANVLIKRPKVAGDLPTIRACTSDTYGRVWDSQLYGAVARFFGDGVRSAAGEWQTPPTWPGMPVGGNYAGDRDSMIIRVDGGSIVGDPRGWSARGQSGQDGGRLYRGIMIGNSEVGAGSVWIDCVLFDFICGNHYLWGAVIDRKFRRRHVGHKVTRDTINELIAMARAFNDRSAADDERIIRALVDHEVAATRDGVIDELKKIGYTKADAGEAYDRCVAADPTLNPRSYWGIISGTTRMSQDSGYSDSRMQLDQLAAAVAKRGQLAYA